MAVIEKGSFEVISRSPTQTRRVGMRLGELLALRWQDLDLAGNALIGLRQQFEPVVVR